jgi:hypothetical protein
MITSRASDESSESTITPSFIDGAPFGSEPLVSLMSFVSVHIVATA